MSCLLYCSVFNILHCLLIVLFCDCVVFNILHCLFIVLFCDACVVVVFIL
jgi:hypothetical protein